MGFPVLYLIALTSKWCNNNTSCGCILILINITCCSVLHTWESFLYYHYVTVNCSAHRDISTHPSGI